MEEDPIYRQAFLLSLVAGGLVGLALLALLGFTGVARPFDLSWGTPGLGRAAGGYAMLRLVMGYGVMWVLLKTMQSAGGGLVGALVTRTAMALTFSLILLATFIPVWMRAGQAAAGGAGAPANSYFAFNVIALTVPHTVGLAIAGWVHGD